MSTINKKIISEAIKKHLQEENVAFVLGNSTETIDRSMNNQEELLSSSSVAFKVDPRNINEAIKLPSGVIPAIWKSGSTKKVGSYTSRNLGNINEDNWSLFYGSGHYGNYLFLILSTTSNNRLDLESDPIVIKENLTDISGNIATTPSGNIRYCAVQKLPDDWVINYRTHYIPYFNVQNLNKEKEQYHSSNKNNATKICGAGNEQTCGTCCLYYSTGIYDSIADVTFSSGDLYKCVESKCYQCIELAQSLNMQYVFNKWTGETGGTGGGCLSCNSTEYPDDCGPCPCAIDWDETSYYKNIINDNDISSDLSWWVNAKFEETGKSKYGNGSLSRVSINLKDISLENRKVSSGWKGKDKFVPFVSDVSSNGTEAVVQIKTYTDDNDNEYIEGFLHPLDHGNGIGDIRINETTWLEMFPGVSIDRLFVDKIPNGGFTSNLNNIFECGSLLSLNISKNDIVNSGTLQTDFNLISIQKIKDNNGNDALSGLAPSQNYSLNLSVVIEAHKKITTSLNPDDLPQKGSSLSSLTNPYAMGDYKTTKKEMKVLGSKLKNGSTAISVMEIATSHPEAIVNGDEFEYDNDTWVIDSVTIPVSYGGSIIDKRKADILHLEKTNIDISRGNDPNYPSSFRFDIFFGS